MDIAGIFATSITAWLILGLALAYFKNKLPMGRAFKASHIVLICLVIGLVQTGVWDKFANGGATASIAGGSGNIVISDVTVADGAVNGNSTQFDFYNDDNTAVDFYVDDANVSDDNYINYSVTLERLDASKAGSVVVTCTSPDFSSSGTIYNPVSKTATDNIELYINGGGSSSGTTVTRSIAFSEADPEVVVGISWKHDEAAEDKLVVKEGKTITCTADGAAWSGRIIAND